ncbi:MAG TPA: bifunctional precorrin-2 dehydrogenase/sirohydrochlorin ferrochelatase, partial [Methanomicrobiales archaeon]|nr:bifunctional precorrin-2 dehydrogenase/sirohydrochlorin ferrochelatase [Methanomicrobiales archaeon]
MRISHRNIVMIPLMLDLRGRRVLIFGGGRVSLRKARFFSGEADVAVVSRSFSADLKALGVECIPMDLSAAPDEALRDVLEGAYLVVAATDDPDLNDRIGRLCTSRGILFNNADGETGDVLVPSVVRGDHYCISISTCGRSPAIARYLRISL